MTHVAVGELSHCSRRDDTGKSLCKMRGRASVWRFNTDGVLICLHGLDIISLAIRWLAWLAGPEIWTFYPFCHDLLSISGRSNACYYYDWFGVILICGNCQMSLCNVALARTIPLSGVLPHLLQVRDLGSENSLV